jgi:2-polyprenyl-3-methyl-5-hydroxy-6-metoxy-1,4-benzoquinol methylase
VIGSLSTERFVLSHLPAGPSRVLEVGCGRGELALELAAAGHEVVAIDPGAPDGEIFRRVALEAFDSPEPFDAVVANRSLHHIHDLPGAVDRIAEVVRPGATVVVNEMHGSDSIGEPAIGICATHELSLGRSTPS